MVNYKLFRPFSYLFILSTVSLIFISALSFGKENTVINNSVNSPSGTEWVAPKYTDNLKNPIEGDTKAAKNGKSLYITNCANCHGNKGEGNGPGAAALNPKPKNLTSDKVQSQTDGAIFWKITTGNPPMVSWQKVLTEKERWSLVNYIRQLKTK